MTSAADPRVSAASSGRQRAAGVFRRKASSTGAPWRRQWPRPRVSHPRGAKAAGVGSGDSTSATPKERADLSHPAERIRILHIIGDHPIAWPEVTACTAASRSPAQSCRHDRTGCSMRRVIPWRCSSIRLAHSGPSYETASAKFRGPRRRALSGCRGWSRRLRRTMRRPWGCLRDRVVLRRTPRSPRPRRS